MTVGFLISVFCLTLFGIFPTHGSVTTVVGVVGGKVELPCNITPPTADDAVSLLLWYKDESTTPIYSLDARKGLIDEARHASNDNLAGRSYFHTTVPKNAHLLLSGLSEEDGGEYRCRADYRKARTRNFVVNLQVITPPDKPIIKDDSGEVLSSLIGPYNEGQRLLLSCEVDGGKPRPSLTWWRESLMVDKDYEVTSKESVRNVMEIAALGRDHLMASFTCQASNNNISGPISTQVTLDLNFRPASVHIEGNGQALPAEKQVEVICKSVGSRPPATISWWKGSKHMKRTREKISVDGNATTSILSFTPTADDSGKYLSCRAENQLIAGSAIEDGFKLEINYVPQLSLRLGSRLRHSNIVEGNDVYFECNVRAHPWITDIRWWFEGKEILTNVTAGIIVSNQSLVLQRVQRRHRGRYTCSAANSEGEAESNSVHLRIQYAPMCRSSQKILYAVARLEAAKVLCEVDSDPPEVTFRWAFNNSNESLDVINHVPTDGTSSVATYVPRTEFDYGTLYCWARNSVGTQLEACAFTLIPSKPPEKEKEKNCTTGAGTANQPAESMGANIDCPQGYDGGLVAPVPLDTKNLSDDSIWQLSFSPMLALLTAIVLLLVIAAFIIVTIMEFRSGSGHARIRKPPGRSGGSKTNSDNPETHELSCSCDMGAALADSRSMTGSMGGVSAGGGGIGGGIGACAVRGCHVTVLPGEQGEHYSPDVLEHLSFTSPHKVRFVTCFERIKESSNVREFDALDVSNVGDNI